MADNRLWEVICSNAMEKGGLLSYRDYIEIVLYEPRYGYFTKDKQRIGRGLGTDYYTSSSIGNTFCELVIMACKSLLEDDPENYSLVEIGCEPTGSIFRNRPNPFRELIEIPFGSSVAIPENALIFANEALDALPFHRLIYQNGEWKERGVKVTSDGLTESILPVLSPQVEDQYLRLPSKMPENYEFDWPLEAEIKLHQWIQNIKNGIILFFDYGLSRQTLLNERPAGTARTYYRHHQGSDLLKEPGERDITCHLCWDYLRNVLEKDGWKDISIQRQEAFFMGRAKSSIEKMAAIPEKTGALKELLHPAYLGCKMHVLSASK